MTQAKTKLAAGYRAFHKLGLIFSKECFHEHDIMNKYFVNFFAFARLNQQFNILSIEFYRSLHHLIQICITQDLFSK